MGNIHGINDALKETIKSFPRGTSCRRDGLRSQHVMDCLSGVVVAVSDELIYSITQVVNLFLVGNYPQMLGEYIPSAPLTPLVKPGGGIHPIAMDGLQFGVGVAGGSEAILYSVNRLIEAFGGDVGLSMLLVDFKNAFNLGDPLGPLLFYLVLHPLIRKIRDSFSLSFHALYLDDGTIVGDTVVVGNVLDLIMEDGPRYFPSNIARPLHGVKLLGGPASVDFNFCNELVMKRVAKTIGLMDVIAKINDPQCDLLLLHSCTGISRLYFTMRTCLPCFFESAQRSFDMALRSSLERIVTASGPGFGD
ncbi:hypothetical protein Tco_0008809 [Tanacetum coccineum]